MSLQQAIYEICTSFPREIAQLIAEYDAPTIPHWVGQFCKVLSDGRVLSADYCKVNIFNPNMTKILQIIAVNDLNCAYEISGSPGRLLCNCGGIIYILDTDTEKIQPLEHLGTCNDKVAQLDNKDLFVITNYKNNNLKLYNIGSNTYTIYPATYNPCDNQVALHDYKIVSRSDFSMPEWLNIARCLTESVETTASERKIIFKDGCSRRRDPSSIRIDEVDLKYITKFGPVIEQINAWSNFRAIVELGNSQLFCCAENVCIRNAKGEKLFEPTDWDEHPTDIILFPDRKILIKTSHSPDSLWL